MSKSIVDSWFIYKSVHPFEVGHHLGGHSQLLVQHHLQAGRRPEFYRPRLAAVAHHIRFHPRELQVRPLFFAEENTRLLIPHLRLTLDVHALAMECTDDLVVAQKYVHDVGRLTDFGDQLVPV